MSVLLCLRLQIPTLSFRCLWSRKVESKNLFFLQSFSLSFYQICSVDDRITLFVVSLQTTLATFGIETQTPLQIEPIQIWPSSQLVKVLHTLSLISKNFSSGKMLFLGCFGVFIDIEPFAHTSRETFCFCPYETLATIILSGFFRARRTRLRLPTLWVRITSTRLLSLASNVITSQWVSLADIVITSQFKSINGSV